MQDFTTPQTQQKKGLSGWAWAGIGCGSLLLIAVVAVALLIGFCSRKLNEFSHEMQTNPERKTAELVIGFLPDYEIVSVNDETKQMTIREKKTGKEMTLSYTEIAEGKFAGEDESVPTADGTADLSKLPSWVTVPGDAKPLTGMQPIVPGTRGGMITYTTDLSAEEVKEFYENDWASWTNASGSSSNLSFGGKDKITMSKKKTDQSMTVVISSQPMGAFVIITYEGK